MGASTSRHTTAELALIGIKLAIGIAGIIGNLLVCLFVQYMKLQKIKFLIRSQAVIDLCASLVLTIDTIKSNLQKEPPPPQRDIAGHLYCSLYAYQLLLYGLFATSSYNLVAISI